MMLQGLSGTASSSSSQAASDGAQLQNDLDRFLTLLVTQLQHQDPLDPLDSNEFTNQLVQFANVEQQIYQNANLEDLIAIQSDNQVAALVNYIGSTIETSGDALPLQNGDANASYTLSETANDTVISIFDAADQMVLQTDGDTSAGRHLFEWNGLDADGNTVPDGTYRILVTATQSDGSQVDVETSTFGRVTGATADGEETALYMDGVRVPMGNVMSIIVTGQSTVQQQESSQQ